MIKNNNNECPLHSLFNKYWAFMQKILTYQYTNQFLEKDLHKIIDI